MTEAMPFLRKPILLSYDPRPCRCFFFWIPGEFEMLGASEVPLRQGFACGKTLVRRKRAAPLCGAPVLSGIYS